jgi:hypothetical protein
MSPPDPKSPGERQSNVKDPYNNMIEAWSEGPPTPGQPTGDPNVLRLYVPAERAMIKMGAGDPPGIQIETDNHVHVATKTTAISIGANGGPLVGGKPSGFALYADGDLTEIIKGTAYVDVTQDSLDIRQANQVTNIAGEHDITSGPKTERIEGTSEVTSGAKTETIKGDYLENVHGAHTETVTGDFKLTAKHVSIKAVDETTTLLGNQLKTTVGKEDETTVGPKHSNYLGVWSAIYLGAKVEITVAFNLAVHALKMERTLINMAKKAVSLERTEVRMQNVDLDLGKFDIRLSKGKTVIENLAVLILK